MDTLEEFEKVKPRKPLIFFLIPLAMLAGVALVLVSLYERERPQVSIVSDLARIGVHATAEIHLGDRRSGLQSVEVLISQGKSEKKLFEKKYPRQGLLHRYGPRKASERFEINLLPLKFRDGKAVLEIRVRDYSFCNWMAGNLTRVRYEVMLDTRPPLVSRDGGSRYIIPGGSGAVAFSANEPLRSYGVEINDTFFPGIPLTRQGRGGYGVIFAVPHDTREITLARIVAVDLAGNRGEMPLSLVLRHSRVKTDRIEIPDSFLDRKLPEFRSYYPELQQIEDKAAAFVEINNRIRKENGARIRELTSRVTPEIMWKGRFLRLPRSSRRASFAEHRTYFYRGRKIDAQVHLGMDLASVSHARVPAANDGVVVFTGYLGIYGNTVIVDHGAGVYSLYAHLSQIAVQEGQKVARGDLLALTGSTGMAGGDHLHFSVLVHGVFVNPLEWWDENWLNLNISGYLR